MTKTALYTSNRRLILSEFEFCFSTETKYYRINISASIPKCYPSAKFAFVYTAKTKYRNFEANIPRKGISGSQSQFPHSCVCE